MEYKLYPKIELHAHLSGSISNEVTSNLLKAREHLMDKDTFDDMLSTLTSGSQRSMKECFNIFKIIHMLTDTIDSIKLITYEVIKDFSEDNVCYLELRTTPKCVPGVYTKQQYLEAVLDSVIKAEESMKIIVRLLVSIDRSRGTEDGWDTLSIVKELLKHHKYGKYLRGIDLSGNPDVGSLDDYLPHLRESKRIGLKNSVHLLEVNTVSAFQEAEKAIDEDLVDRIGHGTFLHPRSGGSQTLTNAVVGKKIPIELCITSNLKSGTVNELEDHHTKYWREENHAIAICTDDKGVFATCLSEELGLFCKVTNCSSKDVVDVILSSLEFSFLEEETKRKIHKEITSSLNLM